MSHLNNNVFATVYVQRLTSVVGRVVTKLVGTGRARPALTKSDQQGRGKNENRPAKKIKNKKMFFLGKKLTDWHISSKIG